MTVLDYYGLTESYPLVANYPFLEVRDGSMGKPMPGWDVQLLDEDEYSVGEGERGEIVLRARSNPHYPLGYWGNDEASLETFGGEWFHTKDAAVRDEGGYIWYVGRADDVIIAAGYRIGPFEVESAGPRGMIKSRGERYLHPRPVALRVRVSQAHGLSGCSTSVWMSPCAAAEPARPPPAPRSTQAAPTASAAPTSGPAT